MGSGGRYEKRQFGFPWIRAAVRVSSCFPFQLHFLLMVHVVQARYRVPGTRWAEDGIAGRHVGLVRVVFYFCGHGVRGIFDS